MKRSFFPAALLVLLVGNPRPSAAQETGVKRAHPYQSRYLVFGFRDRAGTPGILAMDFNKTSLSASVVSLKYQ